MLTTSGGGSRWGLTSTAARPARSPEDKGIPEGRAALPAVDRILRSEGACELISRYGRQLVVDAVRAALAERRRRGGVATVATIVDDDLLNEIGRRFDATFADASRLG